MRTQEMMTLTCLLGSLVLIEASVVHIMEPSRCGEGADCVLLRQCPQLLDKLRTRSAQQRKAVKSAICGYQSDLAKVCCPTTLSTTSDPRLTPRIIVFPGVATGAASSRSPLPITVPRNKTSSYVTVALSSGTERSQNENTYSNALYSASFSSTSNPNKLPPIIFSSSTLPFPPSLYRYNSTLYSNIKSTSNPHFISFTTTQSSLYHTIPRPVYDTHKYDKLTSAHSFPSYSTPRTHHTSNSHLEPFQLSTTSTLFHSFPTTTPDFLYSHTTTPASSSPWPTSPLSHATGSISGSTKKVFDFKDGDSSSRPALPANLSDSSGPWPTRCGSLFEGLRIHGGSTTMLGEYPWMAAIGYSSVTSAVPVFQCSGSLITSRYIVTVAHCFDKAFIRRMKAVVVRVGDWRLSSDPDCTGVLCAPPMQESSILRIIIHHQYRKRFQFSDDIALVKLAETIQFKRFISPLCLPSFPPGLSSNVSLGESYVVAGWGHTENGTSSDVLKKVFLKVVEPRRCKKVFTDNFNIDGKQLCLGGDRGEDTCKGDSGSPVMKLSSSDEAVSGHSYYVLALTSYGTKECAKENYPAVYTTVAHYVPWIRNVVELGSDN